MPGARISLPRNSAGCTEIAGWVYSTAKPSILIYQRGRLGRAGQERAQGHLPYLPICGFITEWRYTTVHASPLPKYSQDMGRANIDPSVLPCPQLSQGSRLCCDKAKWRSWRNEASLLTAEAPEKCQDMTLYSAALTDEPVMPLTALFQDHNHDN